MWSLLTINLGMSCGSSVRRAISVRASAVVSPRSAFYEAGTVVSALTVIMDRPVSLEDFGFVEMGGMRTLRRGEACSWRVLGGRDTVNKAANDPSNWGEHGGFPSLKTAVNL